MKQVGKVCQVQLNRRVAVCVKKKKGDLHCNPQLVIVMYLSVTPHLSFSEASANQDGVQSSKEDLLIK